MNPSPPPAGSEDVAGVRRPSLSARLHRRLRGYATRLKMDNMLVGWLIERFGNRVRLHGLSLDVDNPLILRGHKSTILFGVYELGEIALTRRYLRPDDAVLELGGSIGVVACLTNRALADPTRHIVVEANPFLIPTLERNKSLNVCQFRIVHAAAGAPGEWVEFSVPRHFLMGRTSGESGDRVRVPTIGLHSLIASFNGSPFVLVCDIEGGEVGVVEADLDVLQEHARLIIMETHAQYTGVANQSMLNRLTSAGFDMVDRIDDVVVMRNSRLANTRGSQIAAVAAGT